ncbi:hypothetical protein MANY_03050 [Mycolicibacterium anyangense]|uniref:SMI1/KNR4 family protein n=1 Tax=Mycolicibacterium anyangense TaxID=1431246 RepID=A0A6N4W345_9MYCO|nr:hypothetical protein [Mycolicibacterium anyangense]BBZ74968.1 hypothetical protein MANY_03050 [Mycolicibacterium anyangense]
MLGDRGETLTPGLTDAEFTGIEAEFGFEFADDHRAFLSAGLPLGDSWPDWRNAPRRTLQQRLQLPAEGILFAVEWRDFWFEGWGVRPARMKDALRSARYQLERVPQLVPVHGNCYLPSGHGSSGNPVLSVYQSEVKCCAADLLAYIEGEGGQAEKVVPFWSELLG